MAREVQNGGSVAYVDNRGNYWATLAEAQAADAGQADAGATGHDTGASGFGTIEGDAMALTQADRDRMAAGIASRNAAMGVDAQGNPLGAYGTSARDGGTATGWTVTRQPTLGTGTSPVVASQQGNSGELLIGGHTTGGTYYQDRDTGGSVSDGFGGTRGGANATTAGPMGGTSSTTTNQVAVNGGGQGAGGGLGMGAAILGQTNDQTQLLREGLQEQQATADAQGVVAMDEARNMNPLVNRNLTQAAANQARTSLGPASTVEQGLADRGLTDVQTAQASSRAVLDKLMNGPSTTGRIGSQVLRNQLALSRSAAGGPGAVQEAMRQAQFAAPELQAQAAQSAVAEDLAKTQAAGQQAIAQGQNALNTRGQDIDVAKNNQASAMRLNDNIAALTGQQLGLNQQNQELLGRMFTDMSKQQFDWASLDTAQQQAELNRWIQVYGLDQSTGLSIKLAEAAAKAGDKGILDYVLPVIGGLTTLGASAIGGPAAGAAVGGIVKGVTG
jgi:hypothetical protein